MKIKIFINILRTYLRNQEKDIISWKCDTNTFVIEWFMTVFERLCSGMRGHYFRKALPNVCVLFL